MKCTRVFLFDITFTAHSSQIETAFAVMCLCLCFSYVRVFRNWKKGFAHTNRLWNRLQQKQQQPRHKSSVICFIHHEKSRWDSHRNRVKIMPKIRLKVTLQNVKHMKIKIAQLCWWCVFFETFQFTYFIHLFPLGIWVGKPKESQTKKGVCMQNVLPDGNFTSS